MKKRNVISILLYLLGAVLFVISNSAVVCGSLFHRNSSIKTKKADSNYGAGNVKLRRPAPPPNH